ncbi:DUF4123 domain-containing protein [Marinobacter sp. GN3S48]|uniref:DUF4123 domain-containing protein n=1 Tax=Marinobacter sp. GN3S48 TaxID=3382302 RepID=UPI00387B8A60
MLDVYGGPSSERASARNIHINYVLIDGSKRAEAEQWLYELVDAPDYSNLFDGTEWASIRQVAPLLVRTEPSHPQLGQLLSEVKVLECGYGIVSEKSLDTVADHLRQFHKVRHPLGHEVMLRFADPTVARVLLAPSGEGGVPEYWSTLEAVNLPDALWDGWHIKVQPEPPGAGLKKGEAAPFQISELTLRGLVDTDRRATLVKLFQHLEMYFPDRLATTPRAEVISMLRAMMNQAINNGYTSLQALTHWSTVFGYLGDADQWHRVAPDIHQVFHSRPSEAGGSEARMAALAAMEIAQMQNAGRAQSWE